MAPKAQVNVVTGCAAAASKDGRFVALSIGTKESPITIAVPGKLVNDLVAKLIAASGALVDDESERADGEASFRPLFARDSEMSLSGDGALFTVRSGAVALTYALDSENLRRVESVLAGSDIVR